MYATIRNSLAGACVAALALLATAAAAQSEDLGLWRGYSDSAINPGPPDVFSLSLPAVQHGTFDGSITITRNSGPSQFSVVGLIGPNGGVSGVGFADGSRIYFAGRLRAMGDGSVRVGSFEQLIVDWDGSYDFGFDVFEQMQGGPNWANPGAPNLNGDWSGYLLSNSIETFTPLQGTISQFVTEDSLTSALSGDFSLSLPAVQVPLSMQGTVGLPAVQEQGLVAPFGDVMAAPGSERYPPSPCIVMFGTWNDPGATGLPAVQGQYLAFDSFGSAFSAIALGQSTALDTGSFFLPAVQ